MTDRSPDAIRVGEFGHLHPATGPVGGFEDCVVAARAVVHAGARQGLEALRDIFLRSGGTRTSNRQVSEQGSAAQQGKSSGELAASERAPSAALERAAKPTY